MSAEATTITRANAMPAPTWYRLRMSNVDIEVPELAQASEYAIEGTAQVTDGAGAFEAALDAAQAEWEAAHPDPFLTTAMIDAGKDEDATYGGTALSVYQEEADAIEASRSLARAFETGTGAEAHAFLREAAGRVTVIAAEAGQTATADVLVSAIDGALNVAALDLVAAEGADLTVNITVDSPAAGTGFAATSLRVFASAGARVHIVRTQTLDATFTDLDDMGLFTWDNAFIDVRQTVLGAARTFTGLAGDIRGVASRIDVDTRYLGHDEQVHDFNYELRHHGPKTQCNILANGVLAGTSKKTLRGTIDLVRGCKGAEGLERETVLLVDDGVQNKTVPVILCNEDDVAGNHGATIGHVRPEQMFYLASRGLSQEAAEAMFVRAIMEQAAIDAPCEAARAGVLRLGDSILPGFSDVFDEEA